MQSTQEWEVQSSPRFWEQPPIPLPAPASTGSPHDSGSGSPKDFTNAWPVPSTAQLGGLSTGWGGGEWRGRSTVLLPCGGPLFSGPGPRGWSPGEGRAALACACHLPGSGSEPRLSLPADFPDRRLSQGSRRKFPVPGREEDSGLSSPKAASARSGLRVTWSAVEYADSRTILRASDSEGARVEVWELAISSAPWGAGCRCFGALGGLRRLCV